MSTPAGRGEWFQQRRGAARLAFLLRAATILLGSAAALIWTRLLVHRLGNELYGLFLSFLAVAQLGGLGDLGLSGAVGLRVMRDLAQDDDAGVRRFLATARALTAALAGLLLLIMVGCAGELPRWLHFQDLPGAGSLPLLFIAGGVGVALSILSGYWQSLNYACGNVVWPILPNFFLVQAATGGQLLLASAGFPLWVQYLPHVAAVAGGILAARWLLTLSHPALATIRPLAWTRAEVTPLAAASVWTYLATLGNLLYMTTDRLVINGLLGPGQVPSYRFNYRLGELMQALLVTTTFVALPALVRRLLSAEAHERADGVVAARRLQVIQVVTGCAAAQAYLLANDAFIQLWLGAEYLVPLSWQIAFAMIFALTASGDFGLALPGRLRAGAVAIGGSVIAGTALLNLGLSWWAARSGWILGIALATIVAQLIASLVLNGLSCRMLQLPLAGWLFRACALPLIALGIAGLIRLYVPLTGLTQTASALALNLLLLGSLLLALRAGPAFWKEEWNRFFKMFVPA